MFLNDVLTFHRKFGLTGGSSSVIRNLTSDEIRYRLKFLYEELGETRKAFGVREPSQSREAMISHFNNVYIDASKYDELEVIDGLLDLVWVAFGTLDLMEISEDQIRSHWEEISRANLSKERSTGADDPRSKRKNSLDIVKPEGWKGPDHKKVMDTYVKKAFEKK